MSPSAAIRPIALFALACTLAACAAAPRSRTVVVESAQPSALQPAPVPHQAPTYAQSAAAANPAPTPGGMPAPQVVARRHKARVQSGEFRIDGYNVYDAEDGRLWVFRSGSDGLKSFLTKGEPAKRVTLIAEGPGGRTLMGSDSSALEDYANTMRYGADGYTVMGKDGRLWVFETGSENHRMYQSKGEPAKRVTLIGEGPDGTTLLGADKGVMRAYAAKVRFQLPGFAVIGAEEGRLWVFKDGSEHHETFKTKGEPAKRVTLIAEGPDGRTLMGSDKAVMKDFADSWRFAAPGFVVIADEGRLWVFREGSEAYAMFKAKGEPAKRVTQIGTGPDGRTLMGAERSTLDDYARAARGQ